MSKATNKLDKFFAKLSNAVKQDINKIAYPKVGKFTVDLIVKRTRLGFGVDANYKPKEKLKPLSERYIEHRSMFEGLDATTRPRKSNLTLTGQMLRSMDYSVKDDNLIIFPSGTRDDGITNEKIAEYNAKKGRIFNRVSQLEFNQIIRYYRKTFGDLLKLKGLLK